MTNHTEDPLSSPAAGLELLEQGTGARAARRSARQRGDEPDADPRSAALDPPRRRPSRRWMAVFASCMVVALGASLVLSYVGVRTVRSSKAGRIVSTVTDPAAPGFEAFVEPTPTLVVLHDAAEHVLDTEMVGVRSGVIRRMDDEVELECRRL